MANFVMFDVNLPRMIWTIEHDVVTSDPNGYLHPGLVSLITHFNVRVLFL